MKWFLVGYVVFGSGGDPMIVQSYSPPTREFRIEMPSQEVCETIKALNKFQNVECWGKSDKPEQNTGALVLPQESWRAR